MSVYFKEQQRFTQGGQWAIILVSTIIVLGVSAYWFINTYVLIKQYLFDQAWESKPLSDVVLVFSTLGIWIVLGAIIWIIFTSKLHTEIRDKAIFFRFPVFINGLRRLGFESIESWKIKEFNAILDYGGVGIRTWHRKKKAYIVKGKYGMQFFLKDGRNILIGTQKPNEMEQAMQKEWDRYKNIFTE